MEIKQSESQSEDTDVTFCKRQKVANDARRDQCGNQKIGPEKAALLVVNTLKHQAQGLKRCRHAFCGKPCDQQPRGARQTTSAHRIGGVKTADRTPRNRSPTRHLMAGHKFMETLSCQERRGTVLQTAERERTQHPRIATSRRHAVTFPRTACCLARDETIDSGKRIPKETKVMTEYHHDNES